MKMENEYAHFIRSEELIFKHAKGVRDIVGKEFHTFHEIFLFLDGEAEFTSDRLKIKLDPWTLVIIPKETFHQFTCKRDDKYRRCVLNFNKVAELDHVIEQKMSTVCAIKLPHELYSHFTEVFDAAQNAPEADESKVQAKALLARVLCRLDTEKNGDVPAGELHPLVGSAVRYIEEHIKEPIGVEDVAQALHVSESYLMKLFKRDMNIPVYRYITEKRLIVAAREIENGVPATKAAELAGFGDYSGFYKLYKKMFGVSPSAASKTKLI